MNFWTIKMIEIDFSYNKFEKLNHFWIHRPFIHIFRTFKFTHWALAIYNSWAFTSFLTKCLLKVDKSPALGKYTNIYNFHLSHSCLLLSWILLTRYCCITTWPSFIAWLPENLANLSLFFPQLFRLNSLRSRTFYWRETLFSV